MTKGIHHITAIASDPQETYDFYSKVLGLRFVKMSVNQDDTETYHLFFGDRLGHPGMDLTFFTFQPVRQGIRGNGLLTKISFAVPAKSLTFWKQRFTEMQIKHDDEKLILNKRRVVFYDRDDQKLELVGVPESELDDEADIWTTGVIMEENAVRNFYAATLTTWDKDLLLGILDPVFGYKPTRQEANITRFEVDNSTRASVIEIEETGTKEFGQQGAGTVHHIAFRAKDEAEQLAMRDRVISIGLSPTEVIDRFYFKSVYFRTPAGILFEIATDGPGFTADQKEEELGKSLALPPFLEAQRSEIEANLIPIKLN